jgi:molybdopterin-guanine dinucleotide biosynthesis protein A
MIGIVLSGGRNTRFPRLKGFIDVQGKTIIERNIEILKSLVGEVFISANEPAPYFRLGLPIIGDIVESGGPVTGIYSVLRHTGADRAVVLACDMPFINIGLIRYITEVPGGDAVVPVFNGRPQHLPAVYASSALGAMLACFRSGDRSRGGLIEEIDAKLVDENVVRELDPEGSSFVNINTVEDLQEVLERAQGG